MTHAFSQRPHGKPTAWMDDAACRGRSDLDWDQTDQIERRGGSTPGRPLEVDPEILRLCRYCPVREECEAFGKGPPAEYGIWGGKYFGTDRTFRLVERKEDE